MYTGLDQPSCPCPASWASGDKEPKEQQVSFSTLALQLTMVGPFKTHLCAFYAQLFFSTESQTSHVCSSLSFSEFSCLMLCRNCCLLLHWNLQPLSYIPALINTSFVWGFSPALTKSMGSLAFIPAGLGQPSGSGFSLPWSPAITGLPLWLVWLFVPSHSSTAWSPAHRFSPRVLREISGGYVFQINQHTKRVRFFLSQLWHS